MREINAQRAGHYRVIKPSLSLPQWEFIWNDQLHINVMTLGNQSDRLPYTPTPWVTRTPKGRPPSLRVLVI